jgi:ABC-type multidrug transport system fused ATPase/permease subunit
MKLSSSYYFGVFYRFLQFRLFIILLISLMAALAEGIGIVMLLPLLVIMTGEGKSDESTVYDAVAFLFSAMGMSLTISSILGFIAIFFLLKAILLFSGEAYKAHLKAELQSDVKGALFAKYCNIDYSYYISKDTGHFLNVMTAHVGKFVGGAHLLMSFGSSVITTALYLTLGLLISWEFGLSAIVLGFSLLFLFKRLNEHVRRISKVQAIETSRFSKRLVQSFQAFKYLAATGQAKTYGQSVIDSIGALSKHQRRVDVAGAFSAKIREPLAVVSILALLIFHLMFVDSKVAPILVSILLFYRSLNSVLSIQGLWQRFVSITGSVDVVIEEFETVDSHLEANGVQGMQNFSRAVRYDNVRFMYPESEKPVLNKFCLEIKKNTSIALVGLSGSGKSTAVDLLTGILRPTSGRVLLDDVSLTEVDLRVFRKTIGFVSQDPPLFDASIEVNIAMKSSLSDCERKKVRDVASRASVDEFVQSMPQGYQTTIGDRGVRLSGGQKQRIAIARELYREPSILIMDEATSALDSESEAAIRHSIDLLNGKMTIIIIAHRLASIKNVDSIAIIDGGQVVEQGSFQSLLESPSSRFSRLAKLQQF